MKTYDLTPDESTAMINALRNLTEELRCEWLVLADIDSFTDRDRQIMNAWLALFEKPHTQRSFDKGAAVIMGKNSIYPDPVDIDALKSALRKMNGGGQ